MGSRAARKANWAKIVIGSLGIAACAMTWRYWGVDGCFTFFGIVICACIVGEGLNAA